MSRQLDSVETIIEGDSFSAIKWRLCQVKCPWRLADLVDEIIQITQPLQCMFHHVLREANDLADGFAKEGALN